MRRSRIGALGLLLSVFAVGCAVDDEGAGAVTDSAIDTMTVDSTPVDSTVPDTTIPDTAVPDTTVPDTAVPDTAVPDTAIVDSALDATDSSAPDTAVADSGGDTRDASTFTWSFATDIQPIFTSTCTGCHAGTGASGGMSLESGMAYGNLVNVTSNCTSTRKRVVPGSTATSLIWLKLSNDAAKCGSAMPLGTSGLKTTNPAAFAKIETWIAEGAPNN